MKALLPIENTDASQMTLEWAVNFLSPTTDVYVLHVIDPRLGTPFMETVEDLLNRARSTFVRHGFSFVYAEHVTGLPAEEICQYADEHDIQMIIMGAHNRTELGKIFLGSVSSAVFKRAKQQVLILRNEPRPSLTMNIDGAYPQGLPNQRD